MYGPLRIAVFGLTLAIALPLAAQHASADETVELGAKVVRVSRSGKRTLATIDKGSRAGLRVGVTGELYPMRTKAGASSASVDFYVRLAKARVLKVTDTSATLVLEALADSIAAGAYASFDVRVPDELARSALFRIAALGVNLHPQYSDAPYLTVEDMIADPSTARRDTAIAAMIRDLKAMKATVESVLTNRIEEGKYHGKTAGEVIDTLDPAQLRDFFLFVEGFPGRYIGHDWKLPEVYFTWVVNGTPSGETERRRRAAQKVIADARDAASKGQLAQARTLWSDVLRELPDDDDAKQAVERIDRILLLSRGLRDDPDDTAGRYQLMRLLKTVGAHDRALEHYARLRKQGYAPDAVERFRGEVFVAQKSWKNAEKVFAALARKQPENQNLARWLRYARLRGRLERKPDDARARLDLGILHEDLGNWDSAVTAYRKVLEVRRASSAQRAEASRRQARISLHKELEGVLDFARDAIRTHSIATARKRIEQALALSDRLGDDVDADEFLAELAELARNKAEEALALELHRERVKRTPESITTQAAYAFALLVFDRLDEAEKVLERALSLRGDKGHPQQLLSQIASVRGDFARAERLAKEAAQDQNYAWPRRELARVAAHKDEWQEAARQAARAAELKGDAWEIQATHAAVALGLSAHEALQAKPDSPRERLRLIRALAALGLPGRVAREIERLPTGSDWRANAWWALAVSSHPRVSLDERLAAANKSNPTTPQRKRTLALLKARTQLRARPGDDQARVELGRLYLLDQSYHRALATLAPLLTAKTPVNPVVGDLVHSARQALKMSDRLETAGDALRTREDTRAGGSIAREARTLFDKAGIVGGRVQARTLAASALSIEGKYQEAIAILEDASSLAQRDGDALAAAHVAVQLGWVRSQIGTLEDQRKALEVQRTLCDDLDEQLCLYGAYIQLANVALESGRATDAIDSARRAWKLAGQLARDDLARNARFVMADGNLVANRLSETERLANDLLEDSRTHEDIDNEQYSLLLLGAVASMRGQGKRARARFDDVYQLGTRTGKTAWRALARRLEGEAWLISDHEPKRAIGTLDKAAALYATIDQGWAVEERGGVLRMLADAYLQSGDTRRARDAIGKATAILQTFQRESDTGTAFALFALIAAAEANGAEALEHAKRALDATKDLNSPSLQWMSWYAAAKAYGILGKAKDALEAYERSIDLLGKALLGAGGDSDREGFLNTGRVRDVYRDAIDAMLAAGNPRRAVELLELSRDARLQQMFDPTQIETQDPQLRARLEQLRETRARVQGLEKQLTEVRAKPKGERDEARVRALGQQIARSRQELQQVVLDLKLNNRRLFQALSMDPQNLVARRNELPADSVVIEYFVAEDALYAFVISAGRNEPAVVKVAVASEALEAAVMAFRRAIVEEPESVGKHGRRLDDWLLEPLRPHLGDAKTLILMPFGPLYYVPFDALVVSGPGEAPRYAIEEFRISVQTETTLERLLEPARPRSNGTLLAVANPDGSLPSAQREVRRIVRGAMPDARILERKAATIDRFTTMAGGFRYLHLATHGVLDPDPRKTHLKLSDGALSVRQIAGLQGLDRGNELVVLSACDTALEAGKSTGDELVSLAYAFARAGAPALVASLWQVSDASTAELMGLFYRSLEQRGGDRLDALRDAKLNLLRARRGNKTPYASPWHWAGFQLYGDFRPGS